jgi:hypothetical protein
MSTIVTAIEFGCKFRIVPNLPQCGNALAGTCERSDVFISKETDSAFVITCKTCKSIAVWPKDRYEGLGRYEAHLKRVAAREAQLKYEGSRPEYSLPTSGGK